MSLSQLGICARRHRIERPGYRLVRVGASAQLFLRIRLGKYMFGQAIICTCGKYERERVGSFDVEAAVGCIYSTSLGNGAELAFKNI